MLTTEESREALRGIKRSLIKAHDEIAGVADFMEARLTDEHDMAMSREYGSVCRTLGILEEQIASISNQLNKLKHEQ